jgi:murein DD-endopeptidase MepM/ murein hydrolase activator NlpD
MENINETLFDRIRALNLRETLNRYLTPISIGVLVVGVVMVVLGPVRSMVGAQPAASTGSPKSSSPGITEANGTDYTTIDQLSRSVVPFTIIPDRPRRTVDSYTIKAGDTLFGIAGAFGLKPETIFWSNKGTLNDNVHLILPGITIAILPTDGVYTISDGTKSFRQIAEQYSVESVIDPNAIINSEYNNFAGKTPDDIPAWGTPVVIPGGTSTFSMPPAPRAPAPSSSGSSGSSGSGGTVFMPGMAGSCSALSGGGGTGGWIAPMNAYTVSQPFAPWHAGIDLANVLGTPVFAADTGVVVYSGWVPSSWGYGQLVVLDHGNGWTTYYAHLNSISARCGQTISRGGGIGTVGTTGNSSGPHLHFETRWNDVPSNPAGIMGF